MTKSIGIIGGLGAAAGARFFTQLITECQRRGAKQDSDFPEVFLHSLQSEGLDNHGISEWETLEMELLDSVARLNKCGADRVAIACNTAHVYLAELQKYSQGEVVDMIDAAVASVAGKKVGLIASRTTSNQGLYNVACNKHGVQLLDITDDQQHIVDGIIGRAIGGHSTLADSESLIHIVETLKHRNAEKVILGCTELPLVMPHFVTDSYFIDPAQKVIERLLS